MKRVVILFGILLMFTTPCIAGVRVIGSGDSMRFDPSGFPQNMKAAYEIMKVRCVKCHTLERTVIAVTTGVAPITGQPFDRHATKAYGIKMLRKPDSNMTKQEVKTVVELLNYLLDEAAK
ncbi:MAG TPA: cytochrome C [Geobacteraceae bacterium]